MGNRCCCTRHNVEVNLEERHDPVTLKESIIQEPPSMEKVEIKDVEKTDLDLKKLTQKEVEIENKKPLSPKDKQMTELDGVTKPMCGICWETISKKEECDYPMFILLFNCEHDFCIDCITKWRRQLLPNGERERTCPICRIPSEYVLISTKFPETLEEKEQMLAKIDDTPQLINHRANLIYLLSKRDVVSYMIMDDDGELF